MSLDDNATRALFCVPESLGSTEVREFLDLIVGQYRDGDGPKLDELVVKIKESSPGLSQAADEFYQAAGQEGLDSNWQDLARQWANEGTGDNLCDLRSEAEQAAAAEQARAGQAEGGQAETGQVGAGQAGSASSWDAFLEQNKDFWAGWRPDANMEDWYAAFSARVPTPADRTPEIGEKLDYLGGLKGNPDALLARLGELGFTVSQTDQAGQAGSAAADQAGQAGSAAAGQAGQAWDTFREQNKDFWASWPGGANSAAWRESLLGNVPTGDLHDKASQELSKLDGLAPQQQLTLLRDLGFTVTEETLTSHQSTTSTPQSDTGPTQAEGSAKDMAAVFADIMQNPESVAAKIAENQKHGISELLTTAMETALADIPVPDVHSVVSETVKDVTNSFFDGPLETLQEQLKASAEQQNMDPVNNGSQIAVGNLSDMVAAALKSAAGKISDTLNENQDSLEKMSDWFIGKGIEYAPAVGEAAGRAAGTAASMALGPEAGLVVTPVASKVAEHCTVLLGKALQQYVMPTAFDLMKGGLKTLGDRA
jgi:hypothetical protein